MAALYIIATPIGNLEDITARALRILGEVEYIFAEDTRITSRLLDHYGIATNLKSLHQHSTGKDFEKIKTLLLEGMNCAYVTDAGTPGVSDPGGKLIEYVLNEVPGTSVIPIPGPSALMAALSVAGIPMEHFLFLGFLPHKKGRQTKLKEIESSEYPVILYESVHRIRKALGELATLGKHVIVCREMTKKFESIYRGTAEEVLQKLPESETKGEFVIIAYDQRKKA